MWLIMIKLGFAPVHYSIEHKTVLFYDMYDTGLKQVQLRGDYCWVPDAVSPTPMVMQSLLKCQENRFSGVRVYFCGFAVIIYWW